MSRHVPINYYQYGSFNRAEFDAFSDANDEANNVVSVDSILPDDLLERILAYLPVASLFRAGCVCKRWHDIVTSKRFLWNSSSSIYHRSPGISCLPALMSHMDMHMIPLLGSGTALNFLTLLHPIGSLLLLLAWSAS
uniref:F-box domain-containing protein n=1 Tax=Opuntia streptacantha TaxID=393608 RepID=A0A7C8YKG9_OPUST